MLKMNTIDLLDLLKTLEHIRTELDDQVDIDNGLEADIVVRSILRGVKYDDQNAEIELDKREHAELLRLILLKTAQAEQIYYDLRDAKSDGCMAGKKPAEIMEYDNRILAAWNEVQRARAAEKLVCGSIVDNVKRQEEQ